MTTKTNVDIQIRWMIRRDLAEVMDIERNSFPIPWTDEEFISALKERNCIGMVADDGDRIRGFMVYELLKEELHVLNFAVAPWARKRGFGTAMVNKLLGKLSQQKRHRITLEVRETNLKAHLFFRACGFEATEVIRGHYEDTAEDAYRFVYSI